MFKDKHKLIIYSFKEQCQNKDKVITSLTYISRKSRKMPFSVNEI